MPSYGVSVRVDTATPTLRKIGLALKSAVLMEQIGLAARLSVTDFLTEKNKQMSTATQTRSGNPKLGHKGLFAKFAKAIKVVHDANSASLSINHPAIRQRIYGGVIKPTGGRRFLAIPAVAEAYGKGPRADYAGRLQFAYADHPKGGKRPALVKRRKKSQADIELKRAGVKKPKQKKGAKSKPPFVVFWLIRQAIQKPDSTAMIAKDKLGADVRNHLRGYIGAI